MSALFLLLSENPVLRSLQIGLLLAGVLAVFLVLYTTRDVLLRSRSFIFQFFAILLVSLAPIFGFLLYLLIRPPRTVQEREMEERLRVIAATLAECVPVHTRKGAEGTEVIEAKRRMSKEKPLPAVASSV